MAAGAEARRDGPARVAVIGAGQRGSTYAQLALEHPEWMVVVAVAEPQKVLRERMQRLYSIPNCRAFEHWEPMLAKISSARSGKIDGVHVDGEGVARHGEEACMQADAVIIATRDTLHAAPAIAACRAGFHILLEKPMAVTEKDCRAIAHAVESSGVIFSVCHVLRYMPIYKRARELLHGKVPGVDFGRMKMVDHVEPVGHWHWAHSYVRGNWSNAAASSFSFMAKSCHDVDLVSDLVGRTPLTVTASGTPSEYADPLNQPAEARGATRCSDCPIRDSCVVSSERVYLRRVAEECLPSWPADVVVPGLGDIEDEAERVRAVRDALRDGPYGRCAWHCSEHDVADNQAALITFEGGTMAIVKMTAHSQSLCMRFTTVYCTKGELEIDMASNSLRYRLFGGAATEAVPPWVTETFEGAPTKLLDGHGGADYFTAEAFARAVRTRDHGAVRTNAADALASHELVFKVEHARLKCNAGVACST
eukprot:TRINITY_DN4889_c0_g2_i1.p1 TRINITY_DN4889_c0_g2~~TRINITY_DN4889_c0_g2_i1.p1  ORF type:complete len:515 (-),score=65.71 TRINITY_DN4889_c0_g2_i1:208-1644(-)